MKRGTILFTILLCGLSLHSEVRIENVVAEPVMPWGKVCIKYEVKGALSENASGFIPILCVSNCMTGVIIPMSFIAEDEAFTLGKHVILCDVPENTIDFGQMFCFIVEFNRSYLVVDLSGGTSASTYPVSYLDDVPAGGWTDEHKTTKLVLRRIGVGTFTMGGRSTDYPGAWDRGLHQVTLTDDYWMGVFPVTQRQWELVMGTRPSYFNNSSCYMARPVECVSYNMIRGSSVGAGWPNSSAVDASSFLGVLREKTKLQFDLPTEAQWEYACRAGTTTALNSGKNLTSASSDSAMNEVGRYGYNGGSSGSQTCNLSAGTAKVGSYQKNAWGLYDMHGNVWEWCLDWYGSYSGDETNPKGATSGLYRVLRGGSWSLGGSYDYVASSCCSAARGVYGSSGVSSDRGFRLCCSAESSK